MRRYFFYLPILCATALAFAGQDSDKDKDYKPELKDVKVNGEVVSKDAVDKIYQFWVKVYKAPAKKPLSKELLDQLAKVSRDQAIREAVVRQYIDKNKFTLTDDQLKEDFDSYKETAKAEGKKLEESLKANGKTEEDLAKELTPRFIVQRVLLAEVEKNSEAMKKDFETAKLKLPMRRASQILFSYDKAKYSTNPRTKEDAQKQAAYALERAKKGEEFETLVKELSDDKRTKEKGGDLGFQAAAPKPPESSPKAVLDAIYAIPKAGALADLVESEIGFHILKLTELVPEEVEYKRFVKQQIRYKAIYFENKLVSEAKVEEVK